MRSNLLFRRPSAVASEGDASPAGHCAGPGPNPKIAENPASSAVQCGEEGEASPSVPDKLSHNIASPPVWRIERTTNGVLSFLPSAKIFVIHALGEERGNVAG